MKLRWVFLLLVFFMLSTRSLSAAGPEDFKKEIANAVALEEGLIGGGAPTEKAIHMAAEKGYRTVIDLRMPTEGVESEKTLVQKQGLTYVNIPTSPDNLSREQADKLNEVLSKKDSRPAILHCATGNRAAAVWAAYRKFYKGEAADTAIVEASKKGLKPSLKDKLAAILASK